MEYLMKYSINNKKIKKRKKINRLILKQYAYSLSPLRFFP